MYKLLDHWLIFDRIFYWSSLFLEKLVRLAGAKSIRLGPGIFTFEVDTAETYILYAKHHKVFKL